ncbi:MAG: pyrroline-5-carboxylate reductase [Methanosaeta sp. PtaU1.Bin060]|jgi:pyrroline-5-carboxylate reductase|nr:MAG: pyrroline-5-carboxylate reductase [Methanosaeta sp. PtaU1.Bin060]
MTGKAANQSEGGIGIIGCGHLGRSLAEALIDSGYPKEMLRVSYGGSSSTLEKIKKAGLLENISDNYEICKSSAVIFIAVRPQSVECLRGLSFSGSALVVSCMAGISRASLKEMLGIDVFRMMPSSPDTIDKRLGIAAIYPRDDALQEILSLMGLRVYELLDEELMHVFTVGVCLPAALLVAEKMGLDLSQCVHDFGRKYPDFEEICSWARGVRPSFYSDEARDEYIRRTSTKGGITEAMIDSLNSGCTFLRAIERGVSRSKEIASKRGPALHLRS